MACAKPAAGGGSRHFAAARACGGRQAGGKLGSIFLGSSGKAVPSKERLAIGRIEGRDPSDHQTGGQQRRSVCRDQYSSWKGEGALRGKLTPLEGKGTWGTQRPLGGDEGSWHGYLVNAARVVCVHR